MYEAFFKKLDQLRLRTARFRRVALHSHSIDSHDWGKNGDPERNSKELFEGELGKQAFANTLSPHFDLVCITDHMKCGFACSLSEHVSGSADLTVLPGMEVNFRPDAGLGCTRMHLLAIFPEGTKPADFAGLFHGQDVPNDDDDRDGKNHEVSGITIQEWNKRVREAGGVSIAAHVDNPQGIRYRFRHTSRETLSFFSAAPKKQLEEENAVGDNFKSYLIDADFDAIEIHQASQAEHYRWYSKTDEVDRWLPTVLTFDAHRVEDFGRAERVTYIKMTSVGLQGLRDAFEFPDTRIRFLGNVPKPPEPRLLGISVEGDASSFFSDITVAFAENLNCLIGARGSGKSTLVECLRYVFGQNKRLGQLPLLSDSIRAMQAANLPGSVIRVAYRTAGGDDRVLVATFDAKADCTTKVYTSEGDVLAIPDVDVSGEFPLRLFGWNEVETLGREPRRQRELLDRLIPELEEPLEERANLRAALETNRHEIEAIVVDLTNIFNERDSFLRRFSQLQEDFKNLNTPEAQTLFSQLDLAQAKLRLLDLLDSNAENVQLLLIDEPINSLLDEVDRQLADGTEEFREWWLSQEIERLNVQKVQQQTLAGVRETRAKLDTYRTLIANRRQAIQDEIDTLQATLQEQFQNDSSLQRLADLRSNAEGRLREVAQHRELYLRRYEDLSLEITARLELASQLKKSQQQIAGIRIKHNEQIQQRLNAFLPEDMKVEIDFKADGDSEAFYQPLKDMYGAQGYQPKRIRRVVQEHCNPVMFAKMMLDRDVSALEGSGGEDPFTEGDAERCLGDCQPFETDPGADVQVLTNSGKNLLAILSLQEIPWDDHEAILLNGGPVNKKSPGQRSSAMLPLIALTENTPLVIDQPEDNLDKKLIGNVMMKVLAELKEQRQIIVCTHDPNILVGGDAEQVVVLEATSDQSGAVSNHGSIDNDDIVQTVIDLLEGGAEAFDARRRRYRDRVDC